MHVLCMLASIININTHNNNRHAVCCRKYNVIAKILKSKNTSCCMFIPLVWVYCDCIGCWCRHWPLMTVMQHPEPERELQPAERGGQALVTWMRALWVERDGM